MDRRSFLKRTTIGTTSLLWVPQALSEMSVPPTPQGHNAYFSNLNERLKESGPGRPVMLLDRQRMHHNLDLITQSVGREKTYRVVVKSLPSVPLLRDVMRRAKTQSLMVFHQPFLNTIAEKFPNADVLMGKPMPVAAARTFYKMHKHKHFNPATQVQWLIDSPERLSQYLQLAKEFGVKLRLNMEIDVGLRRGGLPEPAALAPVLDTIKNNGEHLTFSGLMGYEPQLTGLKADLKHPAVQDVLGIYNGFIDQSKRAGMQPHKLTLNGAGSHTLNIYQRDNTMNDLSAGSGVVMPTDFDTHHLRDNRPALFIATPILKRYANNPMAPTPAVDEESLFYIYGGAWKAQMASPAHTGTPRYTSTNQSPISTSSQVNLDVDDYMFLRPTQSEFVMLQFGDLLVVDDSNLTERWPVFHQTG